MSLQQANQIRQTNANGDVQLSVANQGLAPFVRSAPGRSVLSLPGRNVVIRDSVVTAAKIASNRPSYINAVLIQSRGTPPYVAGNTAAVGCTGCSSLNQPAGSGKAFPECRRLTGHFDGACGNCKWQDHAARCSVRDSAQQAQTEPSSSSSDDDDNDEDEEETDFEGFPDEGDPSQASGSRTRASGTATMTSVMVNVR